jgi:nitrate/TMAO reductase-like tetraheme cytochrome c subunit
MAEMDLPNVFEEYVDSVHGLAISEGGLLVAATCSRCHGSHDIQAHDDVTSRVFPSNVIGTCGQCHAGVVDVYLESVHGLAVAEGDLRAAVCTDCHGVHGLTSSDDPEWKLEVIEECGSCHEESLTTYRDTFHGQVTALGFTRVARCSDCHGSHDVQAVDLEASAVSDVNRVETCSQCHEGVTENFAAFSPHADSHDRDGDPLLFYTRRFMEALIIGVLGFFLIHTLLWAVGSSVHRIRERRNQAGPAAGRRT